MVSKLGRWTLGLFLAGVVGARGQQPPQAEQGQQPVQPLRQAPEGERGRGLFGKITAVHRDSIELSRPDGTTVIVKVTDKTEFRKDRQQAKLADLKTGDVIFVRGEENADHAWTAQMIGVRTAGGPGGPGGPMGTMGKDFVAGEVKEINPPKLTILRVDNVSQTIELNEETSIRKGQESITLADLQAGDHVFARGALQNDVFVPKLLVVVSPEQWQRMQQMRGFLEGGVQPPKENANPPKPQEPNR